MMHARSRSRSSTGSACSAAFARRERLQELARLEHLLGGDLAQPFVIERMFRLQHLRDVAGGGAASPVTATGTLAVRIRLWAASSLSASRTVPRLTPNSRRKFGLARKPLVARKLAAHDQFPELVVDLLVRLADALDGCPDHDRAVESVAGASAASTSLKNAVTTRTASSGASSRSAWPMCGNSCRRANSGTRSTIWRAL